MIAQTLFISFIILKVTEGALLYDIPTVPQKNWWAKSTSFYYNLLFNYHLLFLALTREYINTKIIAITTPKAAHTTSAHILDLSTSFIAFLAC